MTGFNVQSEREKKKNNRISINDVPKSSAKTMGILRENIICIVNRIGTIDLKMNFLKIKKK